jgi:hypothetical protein
MREQMGFLGITEKDKELLLSTIDRLLKADKKKPALKGKAGRSRESTLKSRFPSAPITPTKSLVSLKLTRFTIAGHRIQASADFSPMPHPYRHRRVSRLGRTAPGPQ